MAASRSVCASAAASYSAELAPRPLAGLIAWVASPSRVIRLAGRAASASAARTGSSVTAPGAANSNSTRGCVGNAATAAKRYARMLEWTPSAPTNTSA